MKHLESLLEQIKSINVEDIELNEIEEVKVEITKKQKVFRWVRIYTKDVYNIEPGEKFNILWSPTNERLNLSFLCYDKKWSKSGGEEVVNYEPEEDKNSLCMMLDEDELSSDSFISRLFTNTKYYDEVVYKREDLLILNSDKKIEYYDIQF